MEERLTYSLAVHWSDEDEAFVATSPEFPHLSAFGDTPEEAAAELTGVMGEVVELHKEEGLSLPEPQKLVVHSGQLRLRLPKSLHQRLSLRAEQEDVSLNTLIVAYVAAGLEGRREKGPRTVADLSLAPRAYETVGWNSHALSLLTSYVTKAQNTVSNPAEERIGRRDALQSYLQVCANHFVSPSIPNEPQSVNKLFRVMGGEKVSGRHND